MKPQYYRAADVLFTLLAFLFTTLAVAAALSGQDGRPDLTLAALFWITSEIYSLRRKIGENE